MAGLCSKNQCLPLNCPSHPVLLPSIDFWHLSQSLTNWDTNAFLVWLKDLYISYQAAGGKLQDKQALEGCPLHRSVE